MLLLSVCKDTAMKALGYYQVAREAIERTSGPREDLVIVKTKIALIQQKEEFCADAERELRAVVELFLSLHGARSLKEASTWNLLGLLYYDKRVHTQSLECVFKTLSLRMGCLSEPCITELWIIYSNIGRTCNLLGDTDQALYYYKESIKEEHTFTKDDSDGPSRSIYSNHVLSTLENIALVYQEYGQIEKALMYLRKASTIFAEIRGLMSDIDRSALYSSFEVYLLFEF